MGPTLVGDSAHLDWCGRVDPATAFAMDEQQPARGIPVVDGLRAYR